MPVIKVNHTDVHIQELNKTAKETVILVHGMFSNLSVYYFNIAPILARSFRVILYDLKSHGLSQRVPSGYDLASMTDDLVQLMKKLNLREVYLAGYSFGGLIALNTAVKYPELIKKLVIIEAPDPSDDRTTAIIDQYDKDFLEHYITNFADPAQSQMGKRQLEKNHQMYNYLFQETTIKTDMLLERDFFSKAKLHELSLPVLLLYGTASVCLDAGKALRRKILKAKLMELSGDHNLPVQDPLTTGKMMEIFFRD